MGKGAKDGRRLMAGGRQVQVKDVKVKVEDFTWCYRQTRWPNMTGVAAFPPSPLPPASRPTRTRRFCDPRTDAEAGEGLGTAVVTGASVALQLAFSVEGANVHFRLQECVVGLETVEVEVCGTKASWLYNLLMLVFKVRLRPPSSPPPPPHGSCEECCADAAGMEGGCRIGCGCRWRRPSQRASQRTWGPSSKCAAQREGAGEGKGRCSDVKAAGGDRW